MKTTINIDIDGSIMSVKEKNCIARKYVINTVDDDVMINEIGENLKNYLNYERDEEFSDYWDYEEVHKDDIIDRETLSGLHIISGVEYCNDDNGFHSMLFIMDGKTCIAMCNPDDGYRSYLGAFFRTKRHCPKNLPDIHVEIIEKVIREQTTAYERHDYKGYLFVIRDPRFKEDALMELGTDYSETYYPRCVMNYMPENIKEVDK